MGKKRVVKRRKKRKVSLDDLTEEQIQELLDQYQAKHRQIQYDLEMPKENVRADDLEPPVQEKRTWRGASRRPRRILRDADVEAIRDRYAKGGITLQQLADQYGVSLGYVWQITKSRVRR